MIDDGHQLLAEIPDLGATAVTREERLELRMTLEEQLVETGREARVLGERELQRVPEEIEVGAHSSSSSPGALIACFFMRRCST